MFYSGLYVSYLFRLIDFEKVSVPTCKSKKRMYGVFQKSTKYGRVRKNLTVDFRKSVFKLSTFLHPSHIHVRIRICLEKIFSSNDLKITYLYVIK